MHLPIGPMLRVFSKISAFFGLIDEYVKKDFKDRKYLKVSSLE